MKKLSKISGACVLAALWYIVGIDEEAVLRVCTAHGFKPGKGMFDEDWKRAANQLGIKMRGIAMKQCTLKKFVKNHPEELYIVGTFDHLFVVDNGIIVDPRCATPPGLKRIIKQVWRVDR